MHETSGNKYNYIDLFAGCGGLSLGLEKAGFKLEFAVEKSDMAAETFYHNFIERITDVAKWKKFCSVDTSVEEQVIQKLIVKELQALLNCNELIENLKEKDIDLIAGGPPCQGFSLAGRRNYDDIRNKLPWQFLELVDRVRPKSVIIENVSGMRQNFVKAAKEAPFDQLRIALTDCGIGYKVQPVLINAMHFGVPQHRPRVMLIAVRSDIAEALEIEVSENTWKSEYDSMPSILFHSRPVLAPIATHFGEDILTVKDAIWDLNDKGYAFAITNNKYLKERSEFTKNVREASMLVDDKSRKSIVFNHNLRNHTEHIKLRFRIYQYLQHNNITSKVFAYPKQEGLSPEIILSQLKEVLFEVKLPAKSPDGYLLANTLNELTDLIITLATKKHSQRPLKWNFPAPTIVSLPDDFVHPDKPRTLTVREMARFQSFPDGFEFRAKETTGSMRRRFEVPQYTQIGNAVPPLMAEAVGKIIFSVLEKYNSITNTREEIKKGNSGIHEKANSS